MKRISILVILSAFCIYGAPEEKNRLRVSGGGGFFADGDIPAILLTMQYERHLLNRLAAWAEVGMGNSNEFTRYTCSNDKYISKTTKNTSLSYTMAAAGVRFTVLDFENNKVNVILGGTGEYIFDSYVQVDSSMAISNVYKKDFTVRIDQNLGAEKEYGLKYGLEFRFGISRKLHVDTYLQMNGFNEYLSGLFETGIGFGVSF